MSRAVRLVVLLALAGTLVLPAAAQARSGPCLPDYPNGAQCRVWHGTVRYVDDGDTLDADVPGDGLGGLLRVRIIGAQAMEQTSYRAAQRSGDCHALDATNRLEQLVRRSKRRIRNWRPPIPRPSVSAARWSRDLRPSRIARRC